MGLGRGEGAWMPRVIQRGLFGSLMDDCFSRLGRGGSSREARLPHYWMTVACGWHAASHPERLVYLING